MSSSDSVFLLLILSSRALWEGGIKKMETTLSATQKNFENLKTARMLEVSDGDLEAAKAKLNKLIRSVNKCITLLSEK